MIVTFHKLTRMNGRLLAVAAAAVAALYGRAWRVDLHCDELAFIRPWSGAELAGVWHGTWDPQFADAIFFRPLTSWFFAGSFELFGVHASAHILLSFALLTAVVFALASFVARESRSIGLGILTAIIFAAHPNTPWSTGIWVMNDFHKLAAIVVLVALLVWRHLRHQPVAAWWPLFVLAAAAFLIKEDSLVLMPALLTLQWARARIVGDVSPPARSLVLIGLVFCTSLWTWRWLSLGQLGGLPLPSSIEAVARNLLRGPFYILIGQGHESAGFSAIAVALGLAVVLLIGREIARTRGEQRWLAAAAIIVMAWYNAPLVLISNVSRFHIIGLTGSTLLALAIATRWRRAGSTAERAFVVTILAVVSVAAIARQQAVFSDFFICSRLPLECRSFMLENIPRLPPEARAFEMNMGAACETGRPQRLEQSDTLTWGLGAASIDTMTGRETRDADGRVVTLVRASATSATITLRHPAASAASPIDVAINVNGHDAATMHLTSPEWSTTSVTLASGWRTWLRGMHRADVTVTASGVLRGGAEWQPLVAR